MKPFQSLQNISPRKSKHLQKKSIYLLFFFISYRFHFFFQPLPTSAPNLPTPLLRQGGWSGREKQRKISPSLRTYSKNRKILLRRAAVLAQRPPTYSQKHAKTPSPPLPQPEITARLHPPLVSRGEVPPHPRCRGRGWSGRYREGQWSSPKKRKQPRKKRPDRHTREHTGETPPSLTKCCNWCWSWLIIEAIPTHSPRLGWCIPYPTTARRRRESVYEVLYLLGYSYSGKTSPPYY